MKKLLDIIESIKKPNKESLKLSLNNVHAEGVFSLVVQGTEFGRLTRVFIADKKLTPFQVQLHTHRYPLKIFAISGNITHHTATLVSKSDPNSLCMPKYRYQSPLNDGFGLEYLNDVYVKCYDYKLPIGGLIELEPDNFHTISCSKGSIWVVQELGFQEESSATLGVPFVLDGLYTEPAMFQINEKHMLVMKELAKIKLAHYASSNC